jgi:outer membrane receptor protein involved in Fe transport
MELMQSKLLLLPLVVLPGSCLAAQDLGFLNPLAALSPGNYEVAHPFPARTIQVQIADRLAPVPGNPFQPHVVVKINDGDGFELTASVSWYEQTRFDHGKPVVSGLGQLWQQEMMFHTRLDDHRLTMGSTYKTGIYEPDLTLSSFSQLFKDGTFGTDDNNWTEFSLLTQDVWTPNDSLTFSLGLRYDRFERARNLSMIPDYDNEVVDQFSPAIGASYHIGGNHNLSISYQQGLRTDESYDLQPQESWSRDAVVPMTDRESFELKYTWDVSIGLSLGINVFHNEVENPYATLMPRPWAPAGDHTRQDVFSGDGLNPYQNLEGKSEVIGSELNIRYQVLDNTRTHMSYGYVDRKETSISAPAIHQLKMSVTSEFFNNRLSVGGNYLFNTSLDGAPSPQPGIYLEDRHFVDVFATFQITERWSGSFHVENLLETDTDRMHFATSVPVAGALNERRVYLSIRRY